MLSQKAMNRIAWLGVAIILLSCVEEPHLGLQTKPKDSAFRSIDTNSKYIHVAINAKYDEDSNAFYELKWSASLDTNDPILIRAHEDEILIEDPNQKHVFVLNSKQFKNFSEEPIEFLNSFNSQARHLENLNSPKSIFSSPPPKIAERDLVNCENPKLIWNAVSPDYKISISLQRPSASKSFKIENLIDSGYWAAGFESEKVYQELLSESERNEDLFFDLIHQKITRQLYFPDIIWLGSNKNQKIEIYIESSSEMDRYLYHFGECP